MPILISIYMFILGMLLSSFYGVLAMRLPHKESIMGRSYCPICKHQLRWLDILPIIGYFVNKGKCHFCSSKIPFIYPIIEVIGGLLFLGSYLLFGMSIELIIVLVFISVMMIESISDFEEMIVIDRIWMIGVIPLIVIRVIQDEFLIYLLSSAIMFTTLYLIAVIGAKAFKKEALGGGDIKLYVFLGFVLTWQEGFLSLFLASFFGMVYGIIFRRSNHVMPLVPFIFIGAILSYLFGSDVIDWYLNLLRM